MITRTYVDGWRIQYEQYHKDPNLIMWYEDSERESEHWLWKNALPDWNCIDCGAHIGTSTLFLLHLCPKGEIFAYEPDSVNRSMLFRNIVHNERGERFLSKLHISDLALGDRAGFLEETLWLTGRNNEFGKTSGVYQFETLDRLMGTQYRNISIDFIKIDVSGWDYKIFKGAGKLIERDRPAVITNCNYSEDVIKLLKKYEYTYHPIDNINFLCLPEEWK